ncbi:MAG: hypothetical protein M1830_005978 [Pleopsidium flavum]|nr:MAG: hypothetical protein M1830_005978 [Pleopsidium flavum]
MAGVGGLTSGGDGGEKGSFKTALEEAKRIAREVAKARQVGQTQQTTLSSRSKDAALRPNPNIERGIATSAFENENEQRAREQPRGTVPAFSQNVKSKSPIEEMVTSSRRTSTSDNASTGNIYSGLTSAKKRKHRETVTPGEASGLISPCDTAEPSSARTTPVQADGKRPFAPAKKPKRTHTTYDEIEPIDTRTSRRSSDWYENINMKQKFSRSDVETLKYVTTLIKRSQNRLGNDDAERLFAQLRQRIHQMEFYDFISGVVLKKSKVLDDGQGLPVLFNQVRSGGVEYPWDIRADAEALYLRWVTGVVDPHLLRGIDTVKKTTGSIKRTTHKLKVDDPNRVSCDYIGAGHIQNGQWWPLQICAMRDGAHGEIEAGIHGKPYKGALSVVMSSGGYADVDEGTTIQYCGTSGSAGKPTAGTNYLKEACRLSHPVRVLRSSALPARNPYRPFRGLRYDGLYDVIDYEILDEDTAMHRFSLRRREGQDPIRYQGVEARPTNEEGAEYTKIRGLLQLSS